MIGYFSDIRFLEKFKVDSMLIKKDMLNHLCLRIFVL